MRIQYQWWSVLVAAMLLRLVGVTAVAGAGEQFVPILGVREGALRSQQIPLANGVVVQMIYFTENGRYLCI